MTDQIPADQVRKIVNDMRGHADHNAVRGREEEYVRHFADRLDALLPPPPRPTLADMTLDEQDECAGMQADLAQGDRVVILDGTPDAAGLVQVLEKSLDVYRAYPAEVTPRPDLPRLEWPGDTPTGPDHLAVGTVIESADDPRIAALPAGSILLDRDEEATTKWPGEWAGDGYIPIPSDGDEFGPWTVLHIPKEADQ